MTQVKAGPLHLLLLPLLFLLLLPLLQRLSPDAAGLSFTPAWWSMHLVTWVGRSLRAGRWWDGEGELCVVGGVSRPEWKYSGERPGGGEERQCWLRGEVWWWCLCLWGSRFSSVCVCAKRLVVSVAPTHPQAGRQSWLQAMRLGWYTSVKVSIVDELTWIVWSPVHHDEGSTLDYVRKVVIVISESRNAHHFEQFDVMTFLFMY